MKRRLPTLNSKSYLSFEIVCLLLVGIAVYSGTLGHTFHFDDKQNIWNNSSIQISSLSLSELKEAAFGGYIKNRPVANISFALNYYFNGLEVGGYHAVNILIHLFAGIVLFYFVKTTFSISCVRDRYGQAKFIPFFTALIWLVHPLHTQSVTYIVQRMNSMAAMFFIMAMLFYVKARITPEKAKKILFFLSSFIAALFAFGSKENTITLPIFILLYEWYFFQDLRVKISRTQFLWIITSGLIFIFILYLFLGISPLDRLTSGYGGRPFTMTQRLLTQPRVVLHYISLIFYPEPSRLNLDYDFPLSYSLVSPITTLLSISVIIGLLGMAIYTARKNRLYSFCILWFLGNLVVESSIIPLEIIFEHRTYLPSMLVILLFVLFLYQTVKKKRVLVVFLVAMSLLFSYWTHDRNKVWKNDITLWADCQQKSPDKVRTNQSLGVAYSNSGKIDEAISSFQKALQLYIEEIKLQQITSKTPLNLHYSNLGMEYMRKGEYQQAIFYLNRSLNFFYYSTTVHYVIGLCYTQIGHYEKAINHLTKAMEFAKHSITEIDGYSNVAEIEKSLKFAKMALETKEREGLLQNNIKN